MENCAISLLLVPATTFLVFCIVISANCVSMLITINMLSHKNKNVTMVGVIQQARSNNANMCRYVSIVSMLMLTFSSRQCWDQPVLIWISNHC